MSECMAAQIQIGGKVPQSFALRLCEAVTDEGASTEWGGSRFCPRSVDELLEALVNVAGAQVLQIRDTEATSGEFNDLEEFLQGHDIAYTRQSEGKGEYCPEIMEFRPGGEPIKIFTDAEADPIVSVSDVRAATEKLEEGLQSLEREGIPTDNTRKLLDEALSRLLALLPPEVLPLEPFEIVDDQEDTDGQ